MKNDTPSTTITKEKVSLGNIEKVLLTGDLGKLTEQERINYYMKVCESLNLNPLTKPFEYFEANGKLILGAKKGCSEQLRNIHEVTIADLRTDEANGLYTVWATAALPSGRKDISSGIVAIDGLKGKNLANARMTAETKAKNRVTLSLFGLGFLDETEIETMPNRTIIKAPTGIFSHEPVTYKINREPDDFEIPDAAAVIPNLGLSPVISPQELERAGFVDTSEYEEIPDAKEMDKGNFVYDEGEFHAPKKVITHTDNYIEKEDYILTTGSYKGKTLRQAAIDDNNPEIWENFLKWVNKFGENRLKQIPAKDMEAIKIFLGT